ncbi:MAG: hypothetical protein JW839_11770 [Candidatus Lokiarchaeota archaeon]|nr:hypothetical protein [Candidatus Lokiarchaeota archaeon]
MSNPLPNIVLVLSTSNEPSMEAPASRGYSGSACLVGASWATNFVSLLSSSVPSHHRVWSGQDKLGIHVDPLTVPLKAAGYRATFIGPRDAGTIAAQCGFDELANPQDGDGHAEATALIERQGADPAFITCVVPAINSQWQDLMSRHAARLGRPGMVLLARLVPPSTADNTAITKPQEISSPFTMILHDGKKHVDGSTHVWSTIDLAPSLLGLLGIKAPYTMVGKDLHPYWLGKARRAIKFPRDRCLFEHAGGSKTTWNGRYLLTVHPGTEAGELFDTWRQGGQTMNLWDDPASAGIKGDLLLEFLWAQLDKECMPMPRIAGA